MLRRDKAFSTMQACLDFLQEDCPVPEKKAGLALAVCHSCHPSFMQPSVFFFSFFLWPNRPNLCSFATDAMLAPLLSLCITAILSAQSKPFHLHPGALSAVCAKLFSFEIKHIHHLGKLNAEKQPSVDRSAEAHSRSNSMIPSVRQVQL